MKENERLTTRDGLKQDLEDYVDTRLDIVKLKAIEKTGLAASGLLTGVAVLVLGFFLLLFLSLAGAIALADLFNSYPLAFVAVGGVYGIAITVVILLREKWITFPIINLLLNKFYYNTGKTIETE